MENVNKFKWNLSKRELILAGCAALFLVLLVISYFHAFSGQKSADSMPWKGVKAAVPAAAPVKKTRVSQPAKPKNIMVDVKGEVKAPGVYQMKESDRVQDAIRQAGGFLKDANRLQINLAKRLQDEMVIYVPKKGEKVQQQIPSVTSGTDTASNGSGKVNVNTANETQLETLPGIGPVTAKAILHYREQHGPFKNSKDLENVPGIGQKSVQDIKAQITF